MSKLRNTISDLQTASYVINLLFPSIAAIITALVAEMKGVEWHLVLFYGTGVFCFAALAVSTISREIRDGGLFGKIKFGDYAVTALADVKGGISLNAALSISNTANLDIWVQIDKITYSLSDKTNDKADINKGPYLVQSKTPLVITLFSIVGIKKTPLIDGVLKMEMSYGTDKTKLRRKVLFNGSPKIGLAMDKDKKIIAAQGTLPINSIEYE